MKSIDTNILQFIGGFDKVFIIPPFQRNYEWSNEQCDELFCDIVNACKNKKSHYLGNITYYEGENNGASYTELILVDGQQRVTTVLLLLCALRDSIDDKNIAQNINKRYLINDSSIDKFRVRLKQTAYDADSFTNIIDKRQKGNDNNNVIKNYNHFLDLVHNSEISAVDIYETMTKLEIVDVNLQIINDLDSVQTVFEKINSTGKRLTPADLIRNYLLLAKNSFEQERLYQDYWIKIEQIITSDYISRFARDYLIMNIYDDVPEEKMYKMFREHFDSAKALRVDVLNDMFSYSKYYAWLCFGNSPNSGINKIIKTLNLLKSDDLYPLYLYLFYKLYDNNVVELKKIFNLLADYMIRYRIVAPSGGGGALRSVIQQLLESLNSGVINTSYDDILLELSNSPSPSSRFPLDEEFKAALMDSVNVSYARVLLVKIEEYEKCNIPVPIDQVTIEHLMPQKLSGWWVDHLGGDIEAERIYGQYIDCIGNLTPISQGYNSKNSNKPWGEKVKHLRNVQFVISSEVSNNNEWKENNIRIRNEDISDRACKAIISPLVRTRKYQTKNSSADFVSGIYPISDMATSMNGASIKSVIFKDQVIDVNTWKDFLSLICSIVCEKNKNLFAKIVFDNTIHKATSILNYPDKDPIISQDIAKLREARQIANTDFYSEGIISSARARFYANQLLLSFEMSDEIQIEVSERN